MVRDGLVAVLQDVDSHDTHHRLRHGLQRGLCIRADTLVEQVVQGVLRLRCPLDGTLQRLGHHHEHVGLHLALVQWTGVSLAVPLEQVVIDVVVMAHYCRCYTSMMTILMMMMMMGGQLIVEYRDLLLERIQLCS